MLIKTFAVGMLQTNCYVVSDEQTKEAAIIDPGIDYQQEATQINNYIEKNGLAVKFIINTHGHDDHIKGDDLFKKRYNVPLCYHSFEARTIEGISAVKKPDNALLEEDDTLIFGAQTLKVLHTPGHSRGGICLVGEKVVFTGDTLFAGSIGRMDFEGGSPKEMRASLEKLKRLPDELLVYPGHGEASSIGQEKKTNPFLTDPDDML
jgi:glyoxylase-like metal-dependent hydrolase (beta-lactamase superfamily II)